MRWYKGRSQHDGAFCTDSLERNSHSSANGLELSAVTSRANYKVEHWKTAIQNDLKNCNVSVCIYSHVTVVFYNNNNNNWAIFLFI